MDSAYTVENVKVSHINGGLASLTPRFENLYEGRVIQQGESLAFQTVVPAVPCIRNDDKSEGFHFSFNIREIPEVTYVYEIWRTANDDSLFKEWEECEEGQLN